MAISPTVRRAGRVLGRIGLAIVVLSALLVAGGLLFLRTPTAELLTRDFAVEALQSVGIHAEIGSLEGPLPAALRLREVRLSDEQGVWLTVREAKLRLGMMALLRGHVLVEELDVAGPELVRIPVFPAAEPSPPTNPLQMLAPETLQPLSASLSGYLRLATVRAVRVSDFRLGPAVLGFPLTASLEGEGPLTDFAVRLHAALWPLASAAAEAAADPVSSAASLTGADPVTGKSEEPLLKLAGTLHLGDRGDWLHGQTAAAGARADVRLTLPHAAPVSASALVTLKDSRLLASLDLETAGVMLRAQRLSLDNGVLEGTADVDLSNPVALLRDIRRIVAASPAETATIPPFLGAETQAAFHAVLSGTLDAPGLALSTTMANLLPLAGAPHDTLDLTSSWTFNAKDALGMPSLAAEGSLSLGGPFVRSRLPQTGKASDLTVQAALAQDTTGWAVRSVRVSSEWLTLDGSALLGEKLAVNVQATLPSLHALAAFPVVTSVIAASPLHEHADALARLEGQGALNVRAERKKASASVLGTVKLDFADMRWGMPLLQDTLGQKISLGFGFGVHADGAEVSNLGFESGGLAVRGSAKTSGERLDGTLDIRLASLTPLSEGLSGPLELSVKAAGPLRAPGVDLNIASSRLGVGTAVLSGFAARLAASSVGGTGGKGTLRIEADLSDPARASLRSGAPLRLATSWEASADRIRVAQTRLDAPGLVLDGQLDAVLKGPLVNGGFRLAVTNWDALSSLAGVPLSGSAAELSLALSARRTQQLTAKWSLGQFSMADAVSLNGVTGSVRLNDVFGKPEATLSAAVGAGSAGGFRWKSGKAELSGSLKRLQAVLNVQGKTSADIVATLEPAAGTARIERLELSDRRKGKRVGMRLNQPVTVTFARGAGVTGLDLALLPRGSLRGQAILEPRRLAVDLVLSGLSVATARLFTETPVPDGLLNAQVTLTGTPSRPQGTLLLNIERLAFPDSDMPPAALAIRGMLNHASAPVFRLEATMDGLGEMPLRASATLPLSFSPSGVPALAPGRALAGSLNWEGPLASLWRFVPLANSSLSGQGHVDATLSGTLSDPKLGASVRLEKARFEELLLGLELTDINADLSIRTDSLSRFTLTAGDGSGGTVELGGTLGELASGLPLALHGTVKSLSPLHRNDLAMTLSGTADITGPVVAPNIRAAITVDKGQFQIVDSFGTNIPTLNVIVAGQEESRVAPPSSGPQLDVSVNVPNRFYVRGKGLDSEWKGRLAVSGPAANPVVTGELSSIRGQFGLLGKQFTLSRGLVSFSGSTPPDPLLNILVTYAGSNITAEASVSGPVSAPTFLLTSQPPLPQDEVVAQVLFGQSASNLGRMEALQLAAEVASLSGLGSNGMSFLGDVRDKLGFDVLRFGSMGGTKAQQSRNVGLFQAPGQASGSAEENAIPSLEVGKYVMDNVYVGLEQGMTGDASGVRVEIELGPNLNLEGTSTPQGSEVGLNWKKDY